MTMLYVQDKRDRKIHLTDNDHEGASLCGEKLVAGWFHVRDETDNGSFASCLACRDKASGGK